MPRSIEQFSGNNTGEKTSESTTIATRVLEHLAQLEPSPQTVLLKQVCESVLPIGTTVMEQRTLTGQETIVFITYIADQVTARFPAFGVTDKKLQQQIIADVQYVTYQNFFSIQRDHLPYIIDYSIVAGVVTTAISSQFEVYREQVAEQLQATGSTPTSELINQVLADCTVQLVAQCVTWSDPEFRYEFTNSEFFALDEVPGLTLQNTELAQQIWKSARILATQSKPKPKDVKRLGYQIAQITSEWIAGQQTAEEEQAKEVLAVAQIKQTSSPPTLQAEQPLDTELVGTASTPEPELSSVEQMILAVCVNWKLEPTAPQVQDMIWEIKNQVNDQAKLRKFVIVDDISEMNQELVEKLMVNHVIWMVCYQLQRILYYFFHNYSTEIKDIGFALMVEKLTQLKLRFKQTSNAEEASYLDMEEKFWPLFLDVFRTDAQLQKKSVLPVHHTLRTFIKSTFRRSVIDTHRLVKRNSKRQVPELELADNENSGDRITEELASDHGMQSNQLVENIATQEVYARFYALLLAAIETLPADQRDVFVLRFTLIRDRKNSSYKDIAEQLDIPIGTVKSRLGRATTTVVKYMQDALTRNSDDNSENQQLSDEEVQSLMRLFEVV